MRPCPRCKPLVGGNRIRICYDKAQFRERENYCAQRLLQELRFARRRITNDTNVDITTQMYSLGRLLVHTAHELQKDSLLHDFVSVNGRCDTGDKTLVDMVSIDHGLEFVDFGICEGLQELFLILLA